MAHLPPERRYSREGFLSMEKAEQYRKFAEECRRLALLVASAEHKSTLNQMADVWSRLAGEVEQRASRH